MYHQLRQLTQTDLQRIFVALVAYRHHQEAWQNSIDPGSEGELFDQLDDEINGARALEILLIRGPESEISTVGGF